MKKKLLIMMLASAMMLGLPATKSQANTAIEVIDNDFQSTTISISESVLRVTGASGQMLYIYNVAGVRVMCVKIDGQDRRIDLNLPKGCYIVKVGKMARKIYIK